MNLQHFNAKIFVDGELPVDLERFIEVFHRWVAAQAMEEMLVDVADYRHVPAGPGIVLVGLEADYSLDHTGGRYGLCYNRKAPLDGDNADRFRQAFRSAANVCLLLEEEFAGLTFSRWEFEWFINDRALAPNTDETYEVCRSELPRWLNGGLGVSEFDADYDRDPRHRFGAVVRLSVPLDFATLVRS